jgi:hypothetical protein
MLRKSGERSVRGSVDSLLMKPTHSSSGSSDAEAAEAEAEAEADDAHARKKKVSQKCRIYISVEDE